MKARDIFGAIVRAMGLGCVLAGIVNLASLAAQLLGFPLHPGYPPERILIAATVWIVVGLAVLVGASGIVALIYGREASDRSRGPE